MPTTGDTRAALLANLTAITGVTDWENIGFSMLPSDAPTGFAYLIENAPGKTTQSITMAVGIGVASTTLSGLFSACDGLMDAIATAYGKQRTTCDGLGGLVELVEPVQTTLPESYVNQNVTSATEAFRTVITFAVRLTVGY